MDLRERAMVKVFAKSLLFMCLISPWAISAEENQLGDEGVYGGQSGGKCPEGDEGGDWNCTLYNTFRIGAEGASVGEIENKTTARFQYDSYVVFNENVHLFGGVSQSGSGEITEAGQDCEGEQCEITPTVRGMLGGFIPISLGKRDSSDNQDHRPPVFPVKVGPFFEYQINKIDSVGDFVDAYYGGFRFAAKKDRYFSLGYGKIEGIRGRRLKFSGQLPTTMESLTLGIEINVAADSEARRLGISSSDTLKVYALIDFDLDQIFKAIGKQ